MPIGRGGVLEYAPHPGLRTRGRKQRNASPVPDPGLRTRGRKQRKPGTFRYLILIILNKPSPLWLKRLSS
eukprot:8349336-Heterocapsa_arctica.AAC.1